MTEDTLRAENERLAASIQRVRDLCANWEESAALHGATGMVLTAFAEEVLRALDLGASPNPADTGSPHPNPSGE